MPRDGVRDSKALSIADPEEYRASCAEGDLGTDGIPGPLPQLGQHQVFPADHAMEVREDPQAEQPLDRMRRMPMSPCDAFDRREVDEPHARIVAGTVQHPSGLAGKPPRR